MTRATAISDSNQNHQDRDRSGMQLSWPQHLQTARTIELSAPEDRGTALALMGIALLLLAQDLLVEQASHPFDGAA
jgi:hypothetical protein